MKRQIYISAGHSNTDPGAVAVHEGVQYKEAELVRNFRNKLVTKLESMADITVFSDGTGTNNKDRNVAIQEAKNVKGPRIDIHMNASTNATANGVEVISMPSHKKYSQDIAAIIAGVTGQRLRGDKGWIDQSQSARGRLAWISTARGILIELCFISNSQELMTFFKNEDAIVDKLAVYLYNLSNVIK